MDSLYRSVSGSYPNSEFEFNYEDGYFYIYLPSIIIIDSMYVSNKNRHRTIDKNIIFHKDSIDSFNFDVLSKKYKINVASIQNLSKIMITHKVKTIYSLALGDCQGCELMIIFQNDEYYAIENLEHHCYPKYCFYHHKAKTKKISPDIQLIKNSKKLIWE